jgi:hypothetical protein
MPLRYDATLKDIVRHPAELAAVFGLPAEEATATLNVDLSTLSAASDVVLGFGEPLREIADLNFQSGPDANLPGRVLHYNAALHARYGVPIRTMVVLLRPKADAASLTGKLAYGVVGHRLEFEYSVQRLWQQPTDRFFRAGLSMMPLATLCRMLSDKPLPDGLAEVVREIESRLQAEASHADAVRLMTAAYVLTGLRVDRSELASIFRGIGLMKESTAFDEWVENERRSEARGQARGQAMGEAQGRVQAILRVGRRGLGSPDASSEAALKAIDDIDRLDRMLDGLSSAESWQELLAIS